MKKAILMITFAISILTAGESYSDSDVPEDSSLIEVFTNYLDKDFSATASTYSSPPIASDVSFQRIPTKGRGENLLVQLTFDPNEVTKRYLKVKIDGEKTVYRDDGKHGDAKKDDHIYTAKIKVDEAEINAFLAEADRLPNDPRNIFRHRQIVGRKVLMANAANAKSFKNGDVITFSGGLPFDPKLRDHSLMIQDPSVIEDPTRTRVFKNGNWVGQANGVWTFGYLMRQMANEAKTKITPEKFTLDWLNTWMTNQPIKNGDFAEPRPDISNIISAWPKKPGTTDLDLDKAPFKLLAIVNRVDLKGAAGYGGVLNNAGEGRFVFNLFNAPGAFNVIFEYGYNFPNVKSLTTYQKQWASLRTMTFGTPDYNSTLEKITKQFTDADRNPSKPNGSCINQIRTNELAIGPQWQLREFNLDGKKNQLELVPPTLEPHQKFNAKVENAEVIKLVKWINGNSGKIGVIPLPEEFKCAAANNPGSVFWDGVLGPKTSPAFILKDQDRFALSINTCTGCHGQESASGFTQIGTNGALSLFITGDGFNDAHEVSDAAGRPQGHPLIRKFNDLDNRAIIINAFAGLPPAVSAFLVEPVLSVH